MRGNRLRDNVFIMGNLHKTCYISILGYILNVTIKICTQTYKESDLDINIPAGSSKLGHWFGALHAPVPH